jgi:transcriptional regulator with XRE-family HTH domain
METQGQRINKIRKALNLSQEKFGEIFGIKKQFVSLLEKDKTYLNNEKLVKLLLDYNVSINYLLSGRGEMFLDDSDNIDDFEDRVKQVLIKYGLI